MMAGGSRGLGVLLCCLERGKNQSEVNPAQERVEAWRGGYKLTMNMNLTAPAESLGLGERFEFPYFLAAGMT
jgi:hypothetical protein